MISVRCQFEKRSLVVFVARIVRFAEHGVHDGRPAADGGHDHVPVDGLGHVGALVTHGVADLLERDAGRAQRGPASLRSWGASDVQDQLASGAAGDADHHGASVAFLLVGEDVVAVVDVAG